MGYEMAMRCDTRRTQRCGSAAGKSKATFAQQWPPGSVAATAGAVVGVGGLQAGSKVRRGRRRSLGRRGRRWLHG